MARHPHDYGVHFLSILTKMFEPIGILPTHYSFRDMSVDAISKESIRRSIRAFRSSLTRGEWQSRSDRICHHLRQFDLLNRSSRIHCYWPIEKNMEVDLRPLILDLSISGTEIVLPVVEKNHLRHVLFEGEHSLRESPFGIMAPHAGVEVNVSSLDLVIVPAMAVDGRGQRLGYGGGYYDRFLSQASGIFVTPVFREQIVDAIPTDAHDIPVHFVVSEDGIIDIAQL